jgi:prephenate dehydrogenase
MAGKETRGVGEADPALFMERPYLLTPSSPDQMESPEALLLLEWIRAAGARPSVMTPEEHDRAVALTSHLPQVLATSLASMLEAHSDRERLLRSSGPGLLDSTRLALSAWEVWDDILRTNREMIDAAIREHTARLEELRLHLIQDGEVKKIFAEGKRFAEDLRKNRV